jgi:ubiquinone/menaquinone biosynthesis C-methylase UbiE
VKEGMTVIDIGCGMGYFSIGLAKLVGERGLVLSVDIQQKMINVLEKRAKKEGISHRIRLHRCESNRIGINQTVDFALTFWMLHEVPHKRALFEEIFSILKPTGKYLAVEPKVHVSRVRFEETLNECTQAGFRIVGNPDIALSRAALLEKI